MKIKSHEKYRLYSSPCNHCIYISLKHTVFNIVSLKGIRIDPNSVTVHVDFTYNGCHENPSVLSLRLTYASSVEPDSECGPDPALLCNLIDCSSQLGSQLSMMLLSGSSKCPLKSGTTYSLTLTTMEDRTVTGLPMSRNFTTAGLCILYVALLSVMNTYTVSPQVVQQLKLLHLAILLKWWQWMLWIWQFKGKLIVLHTSQDIQFSFIVVIVNYTH